MQKTRPDPTGPSGACRYELVAVADGFRIARKTATLVDCEGPQATVGIYF